LLKNGLIVERNMSPAPNRECLRANLFDGPKKFPGRMKIDGKRCYSHNPRVCTKKGFSQPGDRCVGKLHVLQDYFMSILF
jgi:hypothetical protein